jgi:hypothetical protein
VEKKTWDEGGLEAERKKKGRQGRRGGGLESSGSPRGGTWGGVAEKGVVQALEKQSHELGVNFLNESKEAWSVGPRPDFIRPGGGKRELSGRRE